MSLTFTKLFSSITESTVWCEPAHTRLVWITMLAMADRQGRVWASVPGLANRARVPLEDTEKALATFLSPDRYSRTDTHEGRRIEQIDGGWRLLNHAKYRAIRDIETTREVARQHMRRSRAKNVREVSEQFAAVRPDSHNAEAEADTDKNKDKGRAFALPDWIPADNWQAWLEVRKKLKAPNTVRALELSVRKLESLKAEGHEPALVLDQSVERGWRGLFAIAQSKDAVQKVGAERPSIHCSDCNRKVYTWTSGRCDPCWRAYMGYDKERKAA